MTSETLARKELFTYLGNSVASLMLSIPMTAVSAMSGCVSRTLSSSAGGTWKPCYMYISFCKEIWNAKKEENVPCI
jgi:hypothetical protein